MICANNRRALKELELVSLCSSPNAVAPGLVSGPVQFLVRAKHVRACYQAVRVRVEGSPPHAAARCRSQAGAWAAIAPPEHPTYDVYKVIDEALAEDAGDFGDISTLST